MFQVSMKRLLAMYATALPLSTIVSAQIGNSQQANDCCADNMKYRVELWESNHKKCAVIMQTVYDTIEITDFDTTNSIKQLKISHNPCNEPYVFDTCPANLPPDFTGLPLAGASGSNARMYSVGGRFIGVGFEDSNATLRGLGPQCSTNMVEESFAYDDTDLFYVDFYARFEQTQCLNGSLQWRIDFFGVNGVGPSSAPDPVSPDCLLKVKFEKLMPENVFFLGMRTEGQDVSTQNPFTTVPSYQETLYFYYAQHDALQWAAATDTVSVSQGSIDNFIPALTYTLSPSAVTAGHTFVCTATETTMTTKLEDQQTGNSDIKLQNLDGNQIPAQLQVANIDPAVQAGTYTYQISCAESSKARYSASYVLEVVVTVPGICRIELDPPLPTQLVHDYLGVTSLTIGVTYPDCVYTRLNVYWQDWETPFLDTPGFMMWDETTRVLTIETTDRSAHPAATYDINIFLWAANRPDYSDKIEDYYTIEVVLEDPCSQATLTLDPVEDFQYVVSSGTVTVQATANASTSLQNPTDPFNCGVAITYGLDTNHGLATINVADGTMTFTSSDTALASGTPYVFVLSAFLTDTIPQVSTEVTFSVTVGVGCPIYAADWVWDPAITVSRVIDRTIKLYDPSWTEPWAGDQIQFPSQDPPYVDGTSCQVIPPLSIWVRSFSRDESGQLISARTRSWVKTSQIAIEVDMAPGQTQLITFHVGFQNLMHADQSAKEYPKLTTTINFNSGLSMVNFKRFDATQPIFEIDLAASPTIAYNFLAPYFDDPSTPIFKFANPTYPLRTLSFWTVDQEGNMGEQPFENFNVLDASQESQVSVEFYPSATDLFQTFQMVACWTFGEGSYEQLTDLCQSQDVHQVVNARGTCFTSEPIEVSGWPQPEPVTVKLGQASQGEVVLDIGLLGVDSQVNLTTCGPVSFRLHDPLDNSMVTLTSEGLVKLLQIDSEAMLGSHEILFEAFMADIDPEGVNPWLLDFPLVIEVIQVVVEDSEAEPIGISTRQAPVLVGSLKATYGVQFGSTSTFTFNFADPLAQAISAGTSDQNDSSMDLPAGLEIKVVSNTEPTVLLTDSISYREGDGFGSITFSFDWVAAATSAAQQKSTSVKQTESTPAASETGAPTEESESTQGLSQQDAADDSQAPISVKILVSDLSKLGSSSTFTVTFQIEEPKPSVNEPESEGEKTTEEEEQEQQLQLEMQVQGAMMSELIGAALEGDPDYSFDPKEQKELKVEAQLDKIDQVGDIFIAFEPPIVAIPVQWDKMWSLEEREKMAQHDRLLYEEELKKIMNVQFEQNSQEDPQRYLLQNLTRFEPGGITINLNFSDPLLISQGEQYDTVQISLLKSYFLRPDPVQAELKGHRRLAKLSETEDHLIIREAIPRQLPNQADKEILEKSAALAESVFTGSLVISFVLNLLLSGMMTQLWNLFNTLQIILSLPLLAVLMPANVLFAQEFILQIVNFSVLDQVTIQEKIIGPLFALGSDDPDPEPEQETETEGQDEGEEQAGEGDLEGEDHGSMAVNSFVLIAGLLVFGILISLVILVYKVSMRYCCTCFKKVIGIIKGKLMFNSVLRSLLQTFLATCISMSFSLHETTFKTSMGRIDFVLALVYLAFAIGFPILAFRLLKKNEKRLGDPSFKRSYDSLYINVEYYKPAALTYSSFFLSRRLLFALMIVFCGFSIVMQVLLADLLSTLMLAYFLTVWPMVSGLQNAIKIVNEVTVLVSVWLMFHFTHFVGDAATRYDLAWYWLYFVAADVAFNVLVFLFILVSRILAALKACFIKKKKHTSKQVRVKQDAQQLEDLSQQQQLAFDLGQRGGRDHLARKAKPLSALIDLSKSSQNGSSSDYSQSQSQSQEVSASIQSSDSASVSGSLSGSASASASVSQSLSSNQDSSRSYSRSQASESDLGQPTCNQAVTTNIGYLITDQVPTGLNGPHTVKRSGKTAAGKLLLDDVANFEDTSKPGLNLNAFPSSNDSLLMNQRKSYLPDDFGLKNYGIEEEQGPIMEFNKPGDSKNQNQAKQIERSFSFKSITEQYAAIVGSAQELRSASRVMSPLQISSLDQSSQADHQVSSSSQQESSSDQSSQPQLNFRGDVSENSSDMPSTWSWSSGPSQRADQFKNKVSQSERVRNNNSEGSSDSQSQSVSQSFSDSRSDVDSNPNYP